jgi:hypothetical protein
MTNAPHRPSLAEIVASLRFWLMYAWVVTARLIVDALDHRPFRWQYILPFSFLIALFAVWSWDFFHKKKPTRR